MLVDSIRVIETSPCMADEGKFKAINKASSDLTEVLPYLNRIIEKAKYYPKSNSLSFKHGINGFTLHENEVNITKFVNTTELHELLDWVQDLINDTYERRSEIEPDFTEHTIVPVLTIFKLLPKINCKKCGEMTCMAFATKLNKEQAEIDGCPVLNEPEHAELKTRLQAEFG